ncbi:MFS transporter [Denitratisoma oestradiolicum]|nr:MFS transporter [Denitratisoma oestradiolicum]
MNRSLYAQRLTLNAIYPWLVAFLAMSILLVTNGLTTTGITAFDESLLREFGWSRGQLKLRDLITLGTAGLLAPFAGALIDRFGVRRLILAGSLLFAGLYYGYGLIESNIHMYFIHAGFGLVLVCAGLNVSVILVSQWFVKYRGRAIGIALVGSSLGGVIFPPIVLALIDSGGWRGGFQMLAAAALLLFAAAYIIVRRPEERGLKPLGAEDTQSATSKTTNNANDVRYRDALRTRSFWALAFVAMTTFYSILAMASHLFLHLRDIGFDPKTAGSGLSILFGLGLTSKFFFGFISDLINPKKVFIANVTVMLIGILTLATFNRDLIWIGIVVTGFGWGGLYTMIQLQAVNNFGVTDAGKILGTITMLDSIGGGLGIWLTGILFDRYGSYHIPFYVLSLLLSLALMASFFVRKEVGRISHRR